MITKKIVEIGLRDIWTYDISFNEENARTGIKLIPPKLYNQIYTTDEFIEIMLFNIRYGIEEILRRQELHRKGHPQYEGITYVHLIEQNLRGKLEEKVEEDLANKLAKRLTTELFKNYSPRN